MIMQAALVVFMVICTLLLIWVIVTFIMLQFKKHKSKHDINTIQNNNTSILINCKTCNRKISSNATVCPHCGEPVKNEGKNKNGVEIAMGICSGLAVLINPLSLLSIAGFILSIITLSTKETKRGYAVFCLILNIITFLYFWYALLNLTVTLTLI